MFIMCLGSEYFHQAFHAMGHKVVGVPREEGFPVDTLFQQMTDRPDLLVYADDLGTHMWPDGLANITEIPKIYYAVDTPINHWWQKHFAKLFDLVFVDQKPYVAALEQAGVKDCRWLPVGVDTQLYQRRPEEMANEIYDFGFVGVVDEKVRPKRSRLVNQLAARYSLKSTGDRKDGWVGPEDAAAFYRQSRLVLNENLFPGVTTRMLEAMASGSFLFTEKAGGDLGELFKAGEDFAWFEPDNLFECADFWLADENRRKKAAKRAQEKVLAGHDIKHRAEDVLKAAGQLLNKRHALYGFKASDDEGRAFFWTALRWPEEQGFKRLVRAGDLLAKADKNGLLSPEGRFMLGFIANAKKENELAREHFGKAWEAGEPRGALALAFMDTADNNFEEAGEWFGRFTALGSGFPQIDSQIIPPNILMLLGKRLEEIGQSLWPGFNRGRHEPMVWSAFDFYNCAYSLNQADLDAVKNLARLLMDNQAAAEALEVIQIGQATYPDDPWLGEAFVKAAKESYLFFN